MKKPALILKPGREKSLQRRHPWVFSGAVARVDGEPADGETVRVISAEGGFLGHAGYSSKSQLRARIWTFREGESIDAEFFARRLDAALDYRRRLHLESDGQRLVHGEDDGLPGVVLDRYAGLLVLQITSAAAEAWRDTLIDLIGARFPDSPIYERSDAEVRTLEGLAPRVGPIKGEGPWQTVIEEHGLKFKVDVEHGHKTGFYLDQRANRLLATRHAHNAEVLNCFCYTGAFSIYALAAGARRVLSIDSSAEALDTARENLALNGLEDSDCEWRQADVFAELRKLRDQGRSFDLIVLDPPKFAPTPASVEKASCAYKDINLWAMKLLRPGGWLATFTCSGGVSAELFQKIVFGAALDAHTDMKIAQRFTQAADHPISLTHPEGDYLKGLLLYRSG